MQPALKLCYKKFSYGQGRRRWLGAMGETNIPDVEKHTHTHTAPCPNAQRAYVCVRAKGKGPQTLTSGARPPPPTVTSRSPPFPLERQKERLMAGFIITSKWPGRLTCYVESNITWIRGKNNWLKVCRATCSRDSHANQGGHTKTTLLSHTLFLKNILWQDKIERLLSPATALFSLTLILCFNDMAMRSGSPL